MVPIPRAMYVSLCGINRCMFRSVENCVQMPRPSTQALLARVSLHCCTRSCSFWSTM